MDNDNLVTMINDIAAFFAGQGDAALAAAGVESHISRYWEKRMRRQILEHLSAGGAGLSDIARAALVLLAAEGAAAPKIHAREGGTGSDAG